MTEPSLPRDARLTAVASLVAYRQRGEALSSALVGHIAALCGVSPRTMWRWVKEEAAPSYERPSYQLTDADLAAYARWHGNAAAVQRELYPERPDFLRTLQRAFSKLTSAERAMVRQGVAGRRAQELNILQSASYTRRNEVWVADHSQLNCLVMPTRSARPRRPYSTMFIDACHRTIMGWALSLQPTQATVLAAFRRGVLPKEDPAQHHLCGRPEMLQTDNGLEFTADQVTAAVTLVGGSARAVRSYSPHLNGIIERVHRTMDSTWLAGTAFYSDAAREHDGRHRRPAGFLPPAFDEFVSDFATWVRRYNCEHAHSALGGQMPATSWLADPAPIEMPDEALLDWMLEAPVTRVVRDYGIELGGWYSHPDLNEIPGRTVEVRTPVNEAHFIDVYLDGRKVCRATRQADWSEDERTAFMEGRRTARRRINKARREADAAHVAELNQRRAGTDDPEAQARRDSLTAADGNLRRSSDTSLLDLDLDAAA